MAARRTRRGVGISAESIVSRGCDVGGVFKAAKFDFADALLISGSVEGVRSLWSDAFLGGIDKVPPTYREYLPRIFAIGVFGLYLWTSFGIEMGSSIISLVREGPLDELPMTCASLISAISDLISSTFCNILFCLRSPHLFLFGTIVDPEKHDPSNDGGTFHGSSLLSLSSKRSG